MAVTFQDLTSELTGVVPGLSTFLAAKFINRAWRDILEARSWSFLFAEGGFNAPTAISDGTVAITTGLTTLTANVVAAAAIDAVPVPVLTNPQGPYQFRINFAGELYNITGWDTVTNTLTVDRPILEPTNAAATYNIYQCYFPPPPQALLGNVFDFDRWISVLDPITPINLRVDIGKRTLDRRDPQRASSNLAYYVYNYKATAVGIPLYEFWPHPTGGQTYVCIYKRRGLDFVLAGAPLPQMIPDALVVNRAIYRYAVPWMAMNAGRLPQLAKVGNLSWLMTQARAEYKTDLQAAKLEDDNVDLQSLVQSNWSRWGWPFPVDSGFMQGHSLGLEPFV